MSDVSNTALFDLQGKVALVTGGAMGIGLAITQRLAAAGTAVMISDINLEQAQQASNEIATQGGKASVVQADVSDPAAAERSVQATLEQFGGLDILVNNAGIYPFSPMLQTTEQLWDRVIDINLKGVFLHAQAAARQMVAAGKGGVIINIASIDGLHPTGNLVHYDASKGGVIMMTKAMALELGQHHIRVNAIAPGGIATPGAQQISASVLAGLTAEQLAAVSTQFTARIPLGRMGEPDDIARVALFLASPASAYMTGSLIVVDGGFLLS